jgi:hypothetical protein
MTNGASRPIALTLASAGCAADAPPHLVTTGKNSCR